jgi:hypothetical protein
MLGRSTKLDEHDKAMAAVRYLHAAVVDGQASAFLWWGPVYSTPPPSVEGKEQRQNFRDEGLILVDHERMNGVYPFREKTRKYHMFKQFSRFIRPGWVCLEVDGPPTQLVASFRSPDSRKLAVVVLNPHRSARTIQPRVSGNAAYRPKQIYATDLEHECEPVRWTGSVTAESVTTLIYRAR